jgi:uncharacterized protein (TIGR03437 family)
VTFSALSPQFAGVDQIDIGVPAGAASGNAVPLQIGDIADQTDRFVLF